MNIESFLRLSLLKLGNNPKNYPQSWFKQHITVKYCKSEKITTTVSSAAEDISFYKQHCRLPLEKPLDFFQDFEECFQNQSA